MKKLAFTIMVVLGIVVVVVLMQRQDSAVPDSFAECLADKEITMYGAEWYPH